MIKLSSRSPALVLAFIAAAFTLGACSEHPRGTDPGEVNTVELVSRCGPSVVAVHFALETIGPVMDHEEQGAGGSGFVVDNHGRIVTNYHLVAAALADARANDGALGLVPQASLFVSFADEPDKRLPVRVRGANPDFDLALLELVNPEDFPDVRPLLLGDSDKVKAGERAIAIGSPFGLHATVTSGIVSAIKRGRPGLVGIEIPYIQTDAAINPGNSGGPLFNSRGEVIGINNAILASPMGPQAFIGVGFAVPINLLKDNMEGLMAGGLSGIAAAISNITSRPRLGVSGALHVDDYPEALREKLGFPEHGVIILEVSPGGPADAAGLIGPLDAVTFGGYPFPAGGDVITRANGQAVRRFIELQQLILEHEAGDVVTLGVWRDGEERRVDVTLELVLADETKAALETPWPVPMLVSAHRGFTNLRDPRGGAGTGTRRLSSGPAHLHRRGPGGISLAFLQDAARGRIHPKHRSMAPRRGKPMMETIEEQIDVECPVRAVYNQWTKFEELPYFMSGVKEVAQHDTLVWWRGEVWGREIEWESEITVQEPDECVCWRSTSGQGATGEVRFERLGPNRTRVYLAMTYQADGAMDSLSEDAEAMRGHVYYTLEDFKHFIEQREPDLAEWPSEAYVDHAPVRARSSVGTSSR